MLTTSEWMSIQVRLMKCLIPWIPKGDDVSQSGLFKGLAHWIADVGYDKIYRN